MDRYKITFEAFDKMAAAYQDKFMDLDLYNDTYDRFCQLLARLGARVLEIGCGPGNITRYLLAKRPDLKIEATDVAPNMIRLARENVPGAKCSVMDARNIDRLHTRYDGVMCGFCMPYLSKDDCAKLIRDCAGLLLSGGVLYFSTIEGDYARSGYEASSNGQAKAYVYYHQEDYLQEALRENNFEVVELISKSYNKSADTVSTHLIFIARKREEPVAV